MLRVLIAILSVNISHVRPLAMKLAQFIQTNMEHLLKDWEKAVLVIAPELKHKGSIELRDHAHEMLEFVAHDIGSSQTEVESASKALGKGKYILSVAGAKHGTERLMQGLSIHQMVQELRALRARVTSAWGHQQGGLSTKDINELVRFNEAIDQLIATSMASFTTLQENETKLIETMLNASLDPAAIFEPSGKFLFLNMAMAELVNAPPRDVIGKTPNELDLNFAIELHDDIATTVLNGRSQRRELNFTLPSGRELYFDCQLVPIFNNLNEVEAVVNTARDITDRKLIEYQDWQNANFDFLTGLPNRRLFIDRLEQTLLEAERKKSHFALLFIDLDRFKQANDQLGHLAGDQLLEQVAERISNNVRLMDTVARLGGDEFTLILKETNKDDAKETANALLLKLEQAFEVGTHRVRLSGSIGLTFFPDDGKNVEQLMHNADQAMYAAKERGGHQVQIYNSSIAHIESDNKRLIRELGDALTENQLEVYYQPIIDISTSEIYGAEALLRWNHPEKGMLTPPDFLSVTSTNGTTDDINAFVLEQVMICQLRWSELISNAFPIHVNESPASFVTRSLINEWLARMTQLGIDKSWITMELNPTSFNNLEASGFIPYASNGIPDSFLKLTIDNFGIEPFTLTSLKNSNLEFIKINRELVKEAAKGGDVDRILKVIINMAHSVNVKVVAVGVETEEQLQFLLHAGCNYAQGFLFSEPVSKENFEALLNRSLNDFSPISTNN